MCVVAGSVFLAGCCIPGARGVVVGPVANAGAYKKAAGKAAGRNYASAVDALLDVVARINSVCPPKTDSTSGTGTADSARALAIDINLLHEFIGPSGRVRVETVPAPDPGTRGKSDGNDWVYGLSESDNYKFLIAPSESVYLYVFQLSATGEVEWVYPRTLTTDPGGQGANPRPTAEGSNPTPAGKVTPVPEGSGAWWFLAENGRNGVETFFLVASRVRQTALEQALIKVATVALEQKTRDLTVFTETVVDVPLLVRESRRGVAGDGKGVAGDKDRLVETQAGSAAYTPRRYEGTGDTIMLAWPVLHLPPRTP